MAKNASSNKRLIPYHCEVCNAVTCDSIRCGVYACEACKKFFLRNRNNERNLHCVSGTNNCSIGEHSENKALVSASGRLWRMMCPKCRIAKCKAVGMRMIHKDASPSISREPSQSTVVTSAVVTLNEPFIVQSPRLSESVLNEETLRIVVESSRELMMSFESLPLRNNNDLESCDDVSAFQAGLVHFEHIVQAVKCFVAKMPAYSTLPVNDRCSLFSTCTPTITLAITNKRAPTMCGLSPVNGTHFINLFKEFEYTVQESAHLWSALANWNPSVAEFSLLLSLLFFQPSISSPPNGSLNARAEQLMRSLHAYLCQYFGGNVQYIENRIRQLSYILRLLEEAGLRRNIAYVELRQRCPHLFSMSRYLTEIHEQNKKVYSNRINQLAQRASISAQIANQE